MSTNVKNILHKTVDISKNDVYNSPIGYKIIGFKYL